MKPNKNSLHLYVFLIFSVLIGIFFPDLLFNRKIFISRMSDHHLVYYSWAFYFNEMIRLGIFPLWNPLSFSGAPYGADMQSNVTFLNLATVLFNDVNLAWNLMILLNVFLAGVFTYFYMTKMGVHPFGALISSIIFAFVPSSGTYTDSWAFFIPLLLWLAESYFTSNKLRFLVSAVLSFSILVLNALPQYSLYVGLLLTCYIFARHKSLLGLIILFFSLGLVSFYVFRLFELLAVSQRQTLHFINVLLPVHLINVIFPFFFESPFLGEFNFLFARIFQEITRITFHANMIQYISPPYVGVLGFTFFLFSWKKEGWVQFYLGSVIVILFYAMTFPIFASFYRQIPILSQLPRIERLGAVLTFSLAALSGIGANKLLQKGISIRRVAVFYAALSMSVVAVLQIIRLFVTTQKNFLRSLFTSYMESHMVENDRYAAPLAFYLKRIEDFFLFISEWTNPLNPSIFLPIALMALSLLVIYLWQQSRITKLLFYVSCVLILCLDILFVFRLTHYRTSSPGELKESSPVIDFLKKDKDLFRVMPILEDVDFGGARTRGLIAPNTNMFYGLSSVEGYAPLFPRRYSSFFKSFQMHYDTDPALIMGGAEGDFDYEIMRFLNVKYFLTRRDVTLKNDLPLVMQDESHKLYLNRGYYPRAFLVYDYKVISNPAEILPFLKNKPIAFDQTVVLEESPSEGFKVRPLNPGTPQGAATIQRYTAHDIKINVTVPENAFLVLTDNDYPGWKATLDQRPVQIYRANYTFRALPIPAGDHAVVFYYEPWSYRWGLAASVLSLMIGLSLAAVRKSVFKNSF